MSYIFGKTTFCDGTNISVSRAFINTELASRGFVRARDGGSTALKFNSADAPDVINLIYDFLRRVECDEKSLDRLSDGARALAAENERLRQDKARLETRLKASEREADSFRNAAQQGKTALAAAQAECRQLRDSLSRSTTAFAQVKQQVSHDLRKRDAQLGRLREQLTDGSSSSRRGRIVSGVAATTSGRMSQSQNGGPTGGACLIEELAYDARAELDLRIESDANLSQQLRDAMSENDALNELLQATLASLDTLVSVEMTSAEDALFSSVARSAIVLEAQLRVRLTAVKEILEMPGYVTVEEVQLRDDRIATLMERLAEVEAQWSAAQHVLRGLTTAVLDKTGQERTTQEPATTTYVSDPVLADHLVLVKDPDATAGRLVCTPGRPALRETDSNRRIARPAETPSDGTGVTSPLSVGIENGLCKPVESMCLDARLLRGGRRAGEDEAEQPFERSTPLRGRAGERQPFRKGRRLTVGPRDVILTDALES